jgi:Ca-activated chloride channel family protein
MQHTFAHPLLLLALLALPALGLLDWLACRHRQRGLVLLIGTALTARLARGRAGRWPARLLLLGLLCLGLGAAGPRWGRDWRQSTASGRDLMVVVDLSRSMFAGAPSRLELARLALFDLADTLARRGGHRVGLVVFAGLPRLLCPLTHDLDHFRSCVQDIDPETADPTLGTGTRIGAALALAVDCFAGRSADACDMLLLSDGDDPARDGEFALGAERVRSEGIAVHVVGFGEAGEGQRIPSGKGWLVYEGTEVRTRLEEAPLREIARRTGGQLLLPGTRPLALGEEYLALTQRATAEDSPERLPVLRQRQQWFLVPALMLLVLALVVPQRRGSPLADMGRLTGEPSRVSGGSSGSANVWVWWGGWSPLLAVVFLGAVGAGTADVETLLRAGQRTADRGDLGRAVAYYEQARRLTTDPGQVAFNLAILHYRQAQAGHTRALAEAEAAYRCCLEPQEPRRAMAQFGLGNCLLLRGAGDALALRAAIDRFTLCLRDPLCTPELARAAQHNRQHARLLLNQLVPAPDAPTQQPGGEDKTNPADPPSRSTGPSESAQPGDRPQTSAQADVAPGDASQATPTSQASNLAGKGTLTPVPDREDALPLSPSEAAEHLERAWQRIQNDWRTHRRSQGRPVVAGGRDW